MGLGPPAAIHVAASYWTAASDVAPTSAPVSAASGRSTAAVHGGDRRSKPLVNAAGHRSMSADHDGDRRSATVAGGEPPLTAVGPPLTTTGPPVNGGWWAGQRAGLDRVWAGSGSGPPRGMPRVSQAKRETVKSIALKAKKESSDDETSTSESEDEKYAMAVRDFKKFFRRK
nr:transposase, Ptta/En/Spm, transposase, Tnp1/En/Spm-like protein [Tanacetum cinerariifolium]